MPRPLLSSKRPLLTRLLAALSLLSLVVAVGALAQGCGRHREHDPETAYKFISWRVDDMLDEVSASDAQRQTVNASKDRLFDAGLTFRTNALEHREAIVRQLLSDAPDAAELHKRVDQLADELRILGHLAVDESLTLHKTLDAKQRAALTARFADRLGVAPAP